MHRIAIIDAKRCKPTKCNFECGLICPINRQKKECISILDIESVPTKKKIAHIVEEACIGCGLCTKPQNGGCPFDAINIVNIPKELKPEIVHRYGPNGFRLYRIPIMKPNKILGIIGQNGIGKSTIVQILAGKMVPNFENNDTVNIDSYFHGTEMHKYMKKLQNKELTISIKPQHVDQRSKITDDVLMRTCKDFLKQRCGFNEHDTDPWHKQILTTLDIYSILDGELATLSGGELQRLLCSRVLMADTDVYIFDEPTNYMDVKQRLNVAMLIKTLNTMTEKERYIVVIEHDLAILDYIADHVCIMYGTPSAYGIVSQPLGTANGINIYYDGYIPAENMRFRATPFTSVSVCESDSIILKTDVSAYNGTEIVYPTITLDIVAGTFPLEGSITIIMGRNGTGKTTFINYIAKEMGSCVSHKPQFLSVEQFMDKNGVFPTVEEFYYNNIRDKYRDDLFRSDVVKPLGIDAISQRRLNELSGGEMQRFWLVYCLGQNAHIYLLDEPSAFLDIEQRVIVTKVIKRYIVHNRKVAFIVEHDMTVAMSLGKEQNSQAIITSVGLSNRSIISAPVSFNIGMNIFLKQMEITFHTQASHQRARINKLDSVKDREQKLSGCYYR